MKKRGYLYIILCLCSLITAYAQTPQRAAPFQLSGIYPKLAMYNNELECGTGAVVPWADRLWVVTYGPHQPFGSADKLYEITPALQQIIREESIGGTPANRMIHKESKQLFIGPYAIGHDRQVRAIPYEKMPGRHTGNARHLTDPAGMIYYGTMEEGFYEVDVETLEPTLLYRDQNVTEKAAQEQPSSLLAGVHGKGLYSGQGVMVYSNNGEAGPEARSQFDIPSGSLSEWNGNEWKLIRRNQFVEVTGPGGILGNEHPETDPIWATGWDNKSVLLGVRDNGSWSFYRLPKASHSYDGAHGWNTEWPRIRNVGTLNNPDYLMTMHGMFWKFPETFSSTNTAGIRPKSAYLKVIGDFARWNDRLVFGCDDAAKNEFLNKRKMKGNIEGPGQSNSNLWFTSLEQPDELGPNTAGGTVWLSETVMANQPSEPFLFAGWKNRTAWILNEGDKPIVLTFEIDRDGSGQWIETNTVSVNPDQTVSLAFDEQEAGEWIRVTSNQQTKATVHFSYTDHGHQSERDGGIFTGLATIDNVESTAGGLLYGLGDNRRTLGVLAGKVTNGAFAEQGYYELDADMNLAKKDDTETATFIRNHFSVPEDVVTVEASSVLVVDDLGRRWRLPLGDDSFSNYVENNALRICREVATERDLLNVHGTFYELPAENADGFAKIRPVASHRYKIHDYASYRGLLVMTGLDYDNAAANNEHIITSADGHARVWAGAIDDLWKLGKPTGRGGPWKATAVRQNEPSDPYLIGFYDDKQLELSHDSERPVTFKIQVEPVGHGPWMTYKEVEVKPGETYRHDFSASFQSRWIRFEADTNCNATAWLTYN